MNPRLLAAQIIDNVTDGRSLTDCLRSSLIAVDDARDRGFIQAMCYGVCRYYTSLDAVLSCLLQNPMKAKDSDVHALLLVGLYQLIYMRVPPHAAVAETVNATKKLNKRWAQGFVNAILREYLRNQKEIEEENQTDLEYVYAHPFWWIDAIKKAWSMHWEAVLHANNAHPPFALRINSQQISRDDYLQKMPEAKIIAETRSGFTLETPVPIEDVEGFSTGMVSVQDGAAQLAAELLELASNLRVLDACAAPGGKLTHILELEPQLTTCIAVEKDPQRMTFIKENLTRANLRAKCICADINQIEDWWDGQLFDRILLDAPCSASGVIRRHPDIKLLRQATDIQAFAKTQLQLLQTLWPLLKPGGLLVYATCSIFPEENVGVLKKFFAAHPEAKEKSIKAEWGLPCDIGRQILPGMHNMDGFYYARIEHS